MSGWLSAREQATAHLSQHLPRPMTEPPCDACALSTLVLQELDEHHWLYKAGYEAGNRAGIEKALAEVAEINEYVGKVMDGLVDSPAAPAVEEQR